MRTGMRFSKGSHMTESGLVPAGTCACIAGICARRVTLTIALIAAFLSQSVWAASPIDQGIAEFNAGHYDKAIALFGEAEPTNFNNAVFHYYFGSALVRTNHNADAIKQFKLALVLEPKGKVSEYCQKALANLGEKIGAPGNSDKQSISGDKAASSQTPHVFAVLCGCPLCGRAELLLNDIEKRYGKSVVVTRCPTVARFGGAPVCADPKYQGILTQYQVSRCPTFLFFGKQGELAGQMNGVIADADVWRQLNVLADKPSDSKQAPHIEDKSQAARDSIMREAAAKIADLNRLEQEEITRVERRADQDMADIVGRRRYLFTGPIAADRDKRIEQVKADFERRRKEVTDDAIARADSVSR